MEVSTPMLAWFSELDMDDLMSFQDTMVNNYLADIMLPNTQNVLNVEQNTNHHERHLSMSSSTDSNLTMQPTATATATATTKPKPRKQPRLQNSATPTSNTCFPVILNFGSSSLSKDNDNKDNQEYDSSLKGQNILEDSKHNEQDEEFIFTENHADVINEQPPPKRKYNKRTTTTSRDHILAERRRREKLSQRFAALSALIPGLTRMDKSSILTEAIRHLKQQQDKIKSLEEETARKSVESVVVVKNSQFAFEEEEDSPNCHNYLNTIQEHNEQLPEFEARLSNKDVLFKITCEKRDILLIRIIGVIEKHHLSVTSVHATQFGDTTFNVAITAKMEKEVNIRVQSILQELSLECNKR